MSKQKDAQVIKREEVVELINHIVNQMRNINFIGNKDPVLSDKVNDSLRDLEILTNILIPNEIRAIDLPVTMEHFNGIKPRMDDLRDVFLLKALTRGKPITALVNEGQLLKRLTDLLQVVCGRSNAGTLAPMDDVSRGEMYMKVEDLISCIMEQYYTRDGYLNYYQNQQLHMDHYNPTPPDYVPSPFDLANRMNTLEGMVRQLQSEIWQLRNCQRL